jgi:competence ComEA-like helix-hairpin-helix protein
MLYQQGFKENRMKSSKTANSAQGNQWEAFRVIQRIVFAMLLCMVAANAGASGEKINLNLANAETLQYIPGIGAARAADIIKLREQGGDFKHYDELFEISGIGEKILESIKQFGTLEGGVSELTQEMIDNPPTAATAQGESN